MFKNGGIILKKKSVAPHGVDKDSVIIFLNDKEQLGYIDNLGYTHLLIPGQAPNIVQLPLEYNSSNIPANYDDLMISTNTFFGDGSDGDIELDSLFVLSKDCYFKNIKLDKNSIIKTNGYRLFVQETLTFNGGIISNDGNSASNDDMYNIGKLGGTETKIGSLGQGGRGGKGSNGTMLDGQNTTQGTTLPLTNGGKGGFGGDGGDGAMGKGGKSLIDVPTSNCVIRNVYLALQASRGVYLINGGIGGDGGAAGGGDGNQHGAGGGGGGSGAGVLQIVAKTILVTPYASYPSITSIGGDGSNGSNATVGNCGGGGGGSGGGGGFIQLFYLNKTQELNNNLINVSGGNPGNGGKGIGSGKNGINGNKGNPGNIECVNVKNGIWTTFIESSTL